MALPNDSKQISSNGVPDSNDMTRRRALKHAARMGLAGAAVATGLSAIPVQCQMPRSFVEPDFKVRHGKIRQSIMGWTFNPMTVPELAKLCKSIGLVAMEGIDKAHYPLVKELGMEISLVGSHGFAKGPYNSAHHPEVIRALKEGIDVAVKFGAKRVITFTGMTEPGIDAEQGTRNCLECWKQVMPYAESNRITLCLEHLNSRDSTHPMKGHPGYFGDDLERCIQMVKAIGSPFFKVLFDIYHVQIMHGDVIRRLRTYKEFIGHYHTAGAPGRGELDDTQEINYPPIMKAILETGFDGFVAQEFLPTWPDRALALRHAAKVCDVT